MNVTTSKIEEKIVVLPKKMVVLAMVKVEDKYKTKDDALKKSIYNNLKDQVEFVVKHMDPIFMEEYLPTMRRRKALQVLRFPQHSLHK